MRKTVNYNGEKIKVNFEKPDNGFTRIVDKMDKYGRITQAHGTRIYDINEKSYVVDWTVRRKEKASVRLHFEGFTCGDSEKKMIEHIISKYGI